MKNKIFVLILALTLAVGMLASCQPECEHPLSENWSSDENGHWHPFTCEHGEKAKDASVPHVDPDEDGVCNVCEYKVGHEHTASDEWTYDDTHHWKAATCSHTDVKVEYSLHADENIDGFCDGCSVHVHGVNAAGFCTFTDCGQKVVEIDESDLEILVNALAAQLRFANGGKMDYDFTGRSNNTDGDFATHSTRVLKYLFGKDGYVYYDDSTSTTGGETSSSRVEKWYMPTGGDSFFGVVSNNGEPVVLDIPEADNLVGFYLAVSTLADGYGPEGVLLSLYDAYIGENTTNADIKSYIDDNKVVVKFSTYLLNVSGKTDDKPEDMIYNLSHFDVEFSFTYTDDYVLTSLDIKLDSYTNDPGELDMGVPNVADIDLDYDYTTGEYSFRANALPDTYTISITQTIGERSEENPNPKSKYIPDSFDLFLNHNESTGEVYDKFTGNPINAQPYDIISLFLGNYKPVGTTVHFAPELVSFKLFKDGAEVQNPSAWDNTTVSAEFTFAAGEVRKFYVIPKQDGVYKLEIYFAGEKVYDVEMLVGTVDAGDLDLKDNEFAVTVVQPHGWANKAEGWANEYTFTAGDAGTYYFNLPAGVGFIDADGFDAGEATENVTDDTPEPYFDFNNAKNKDGSYNPGSFSLQLEAGQQIRFYVNAIQRGTYVISYFVI
jgi:hypothetical protein